MDLPFTWLRKFCSTNGESNALSCYCDLVVELTLRIFLLGTMQRQIYGV